MFPGFNNKKHSTVSSGDWDRDGKPNRGDCNAFDWKKQDGGMSAKEYAKMKKKSEEAEPSNIPKGYVDPFTSSHPNDQWDPWKGDYGN